MEGFTNRKNQTGLYCLDVSSSGSSLLDFFDRRVKVLPTGNETMNDFIELLGKLSCFKKDLIGPVFVVNNTRKQMFVTAEDIEPIGETTGRCFSKTLSPRDLELAFDKWQLRGEGLLKQLCVDYSLKADEVSTVERLLVDFIRDIQDMARSSCLPGKTILDRPLGPRDPGSYTPDSVKELGEYSGYY
jgi:hypothetical protein